MIVLLIFVAIFIGLVLLYWHSPYESELVLYGYQDLKNSSDFPVTPGGIPKIIFKTSSFKKNAFPREMTDALRKTQELNPDYLMYYFDDDDILEFISDFSNEVSDLYKTIVPGAYKADVFRVCALYQYGGCYSDIGHVPMVSFDDICGDSNVVLVEDSPSEYTGIYNSLMCSVPNHSFFRSILDKISVNIQNKYYGENYLDITGPTAIGKVFNCYFHGVCDDVNKKLLTTGLTEYECKDCKVKILQHTYGMIKEGEKQICKTKFNNYQDIMYNSGGTLNYNKLWEKKQVYIDE
jgi:hypothetical protein